jgi:hypothetical protein
MAYSAELKHHQLDTAEIERQLSTDDKSLQQQETKFPCRESGPTEMLI